MVGWLLFHEIEHYRWHDVRASLTAIPAAKIASCVVLVILNYIILIGYDWLALKAIDKKLPLRQVAFASFTGFVASYNFGATLGGVPLRYRVYSGFGLSAIQIVQLSIMLGVTFWLGEFALAGVAFVCDPFPIPDKLHMPFKTVYGLGWILIAITAAYVALTFLWKKPFRIRGEEIQLPSAQMTLAQIAVASTDLIVASLSLYILLPSELELSYFQFVGIFLLAVISVILTHIPGGVGVFELVILTFLGATAKDDVVASLLVFRVLYYLLPLLFAGSLLGSFEYQRNRERLSPILNTLGRTASAVAPNIISMIVLVGGAVLLLSSATPSIEMRLETLRHWLPLPLIEFSHFISSLVGAALLVVARGLQRRLDSAWWVGTFLLSIGIVVSLLKGFDYEESILLSLVLLVLVACRKRFYRKSQLLYEPFTTGWLAVIGLVVVCVVWLGIFANKHVDYSHDLWWQFAIGADAPRFMRASVGVIGLLLLFSLVRLLKRAEPAPEELASRDDIKTVADIISSSTRTSANLALLGDKRFLFSDDRQCFLMYAVENRTWVVLGDPIGPHRQWPDLVWKFRELCDRYDGRPVFYQVDMEQLSVYVDQGLTLLKIGEEARISMPDFDLEGSHRKGLRATRSKIQKLGCSFEIVPVEQVPGIIPRLREISDAWLAEKDSSEKGFSLGFFDEDYLHRFPCAVVKQGERIIAFANMWLGAEHVEFSIDLMRYEKSSLNGLMDYLFTELFLWGKANGYKWFNMGMAPLSGIASRPLAPIWNKAIGLLYRHGEHFYGFEGLRQYKDKFDPVWHPKYIAAPGGLALLRMLADITALIGRKHIST